MKTKVVEVYREWEAPCSNLTSVASAMLGSVPSHYRSGLRSVVLTNTGALTGKRKRRRVKSSRGKFSADGVQGLYHPTHGGEEAWIEIFVDNVFREYDGWLVRIPFIRDGRLANVLFHELGHHLHAGLFPAHEEKEDIADLWSKKLSRNWLRRKYWWLLPVAVSYRVAKRMRRAFGRSSS